MAQPADGLSAVFLCYVGYVMDILNAQTKPRTPIYSNYLTGAWNQTFTLKDAGDDCFYILSGPSDQPDSVAITCPPSAGSTLVINRFHANNDDQKWYFTQGGGNDTPYWYHINSRAYSGLAIAVTTTALQKPLCVQNIEDTDPAWTKWVLVPCPKSSGDAEERAIKRSE